VVRTLSFQDALPQRPSRILVAGSSGAGKTTLARAVGRILDIEHVEIDSLFHGPGWIPRPEFENDVRRLVARPTWVSEWQYAVVKTLLADRADLIVWLDLPRRTVMRQITARTIRRRLRGQELWNGNHEPPLRAILTDPERVIRWAWTTYPKTASAIGEVERRRPELPIVRLGTRAEADRWLAGLAREYAGPRAPSAEHADEDKRGGQRHDAPHEGA
jgi:adenylate kinase family enzyme